MRWKALRRKFGQGNELSGMSELKEISGTLFQRGNLDNGFYTC